MAGKHFTHNARKEEDMTGKLIKPIAAAAILGGFVAATTVFAEESTPPPQSPQAEHKMGGHGGMMEMMGSPDHMRQMAEMIESCNRMMNAHEGPDTEQAPNHHG